MVVCLVVVEARCDGTWCPEGVLVEAGCGYRVLLQMASPVCGDLRSLRTDKAIALQAVNVARVLQSAVQVAA